MKFDCEYNNYIYEVDAKDLKDAFLKWAKHYSKMIKKEDLIRRVDVLIRGRK